MGKPSKRIKRGDVIEIHWADILNDATGDISKAAPSPRITYGIFDRWEYEEVEWADGEVHKVRFLVCKLTRDVGEQDQCGWDVYPKGCIMKVVKVKDGR